MQYRTLGRTGVQVSTLVLGAMNFGEIGRTTQDEATAIVDAALEAGINLIDTADRYSDGESEEMVGKAIAGRRDDLVLATKATMPMGDERNHQGSSRRWLVTELDNSLRRLGVDHVDLYQIHRWDPRTPIEETMRALHDVVRAGKARYIGASSMFAWQFAKAQHVAEANGWTKFVSMQPHYNLIYREEEREMIPQCIDQGVGVIPWSPLARGVLAGNRTRGGERRTTRSDSDPFTDYLYSQPTDFDVVERVAEVAAERDTSPARIALAWLLHKPGVTAPIVGATKLEHLQDALAAEQLKLTDDEIARLEEPYAPHPVLGHG